MERNLHYIKTPNDDFRRGSGDFLVGGHVEVPESDVLSQVVDAPHPVPAPRPVRPLHLAAPESRPFIRN